MNYNLVITQPAKKDLADILDKKYSEASKDYATFHR